MNAHQTATTRTFRFGRFAIVTAFAAAANVALYVIGAAIGGAMRVSTSGGMDISWPMPVVATAVPLLLVGAVAWVVTRRFRGLLRLGRWLGLGVAVVSTIAPLSSASDPQTAITMAAMHVVAGIAWFAGTKPRAEA